MNMLITARHCRIDDELRELTRSRLERVLRKAHRPHRVEVIFSRDADRSVVEVQLYVPRAKVFVCKADADDFRTALDRALDKLQNHLD